MEYVKNKKYINKNESFLKYWTAQMTATLLKGVAADRAFLFVNKSIEQIDITSQKWRPSDVFTCKYRSHFEVTFNVNAVNV